MAVLVRPATIADAEAIFAFGDGLNRSEGDPLEFWTPDSVRAELFGPEPQMHVLMAELDGRSVGYAGFGESWDSAHAARGLYLYDLYVEESARRHGVGRALMTALAREVKARGKVFLWWCRKPDNERAGAFYRGLGAREERIVANVLSGDPLEALLRDEP